MRHIAAFILCLAATALTNAQQTNPSRDVQEHEPPPVVGTEPDAESTDEAARAVSTLISDDPDQAIGKTLVLADGAQMKPVGPVLAVRKQRGDQRIYLIVEDSGSLASKMQYAVPAEDLDRIEHDHLILDVPGMKFSGIEYDADDYEDLPTPAVPAPAL